MDLDTLLNLVRDLTGSLVRISEIISLGMLADISVNVELLVDAAELVELIFWYWYIVSLIFGKNGEEYWVYKDKEGGLIGHKAIKGEYLSRL